MAKKKSAGAGMTLAQKQKLLTTPCKTKAELKAWIKYFLELEIPDTKVSRHADCSPMDAIWEMYSITVLKQNPEKINELLYVASRGAGKCCREGTLILTRDRGPREIQNVTKNDHVWSGHAWRKVLNTFDEGEMEGIEVTTYGAYSQKSVLPLVGSTRHRVLWINELGQVEWKHMRDLKHRDIVVRQVEFPVEQALSSVPYEYGWLLGSMAVSNCSMDDAAVRYKAKSKALASQFVKLAEGVVSFRHANQNGGAAVNSKVDLDFRVELEQKDGSIQIYTIDDRLYDWARTYFNKTKDGSIDWASPKISAMGSDRIAGFIAGVVDTREDPFRFVLPSARLQRALSQLMMTHGIQTDRPYDKKRPLGSLRVLTAYPSYIKLKSSFPDFMSRNNDLKRIRKYNIRIFKPVLKYMQRNGIDYSKMPHLTEVTSKRKVKRTYIHRAQLNDVLGWLSRLGDVQEVKDLRWLASCVFEDVRTVRKVKAHFYDLEVEHDHSYWSDGLISHNTLSAAITELLVILHDQRDVAHVGAIMAQAKRAYAYLQDFYLKPRIKEIISPDKVPEKQHMLQKNTMEKSIINVNGQNCSMECIPCTIRALNGPHVSFCCFDELDTLSGEGLRAFKEASGMLDTKHGKKPLRVGISTRKSTYGLMNRQMENASKEGRYVRKWTALEFTERCPDERSGKTKAVYYVNQDKGEVCTKEQLELKSDEKKKEFVPYEMYEKCLTCPAAAWCLGDAKNQVDTSNMLKTLDELNQKILSEGVDWAAAQLFNLKPSMEGLIFREFDEKKHLKTWNEMWEILTGSKFPGECTHDIFVRKCHEMKLPCYAGNDFGWSSPSTALYLFIDKRDNIYVVKADGMTYINDPNWIHYVKTKHQPVYRAQLYFPDIANGSAVDLMKNAGLPVSDKIDKSINLGIQTIKKFLFTPGSGQPKLFFAAETCGPAIDEVRRYHYRTDAAGLILNEPEDEFNHWIDPLRYILVAFYGKQSSLIHTGFDLGVDSPMDQQGLYTRIPSVREFAELHGIQVNDNSEEALNVGRVGSLTDLDRSEKEDDEIQGEGGFLFSL